MTYRSESRGFMYSAPPTGDGERRDDGTADPLGERARADRGPTAGTDANWTGTVPTDD